MAQFLFATKDIDITDTSNPNPSYSKDLYLITNTVVSADNRILTPDFELKEAFSIFSEIRASLLQTSLLSIVSRFFRLIFSYPV